LITTLVMENSVKVDYNIPSPIPFCASVPEQKLTQSMFVLVHTYISYLINTRTHTYTHTHTHTHTYTYTYTHIHTQTMACSATASQLNCSGLYSISLSV